jgi:iron complex outermembrane recepter protein
VYGVGVDETDLRTLNRLFAITHPTTKRFSIDNQLEAKFSTGRVGHTVLFGIDYQQQTLREDMRYGLAPTLDLFNSVYTPMTADYLSNDVSYRDHSKQTQRQLGFYVQDQIKLTPQWIVNLGLRHDTAKSVLNTTSATPDAFGEAPTENRVTSKDSKLTGRVGVLYASEMGLSPYVNYSTSFLPTAGTDQAGNPFKPTTGRQFEVGMKYQPKAGNIMVNAALFDIRQNNVLTTDPTNSLYSVQTGQQRSRGVEFEVNANLTKQLKLISAYTYQHVVNSKANDASYDKHPTDVPVPRNFGSFWLDYTFDDGWLDGFGFGAGVRYIGRTAGNPNNTLNVPSFSLLDVGAHYTTGNWRFALNVSNLNDKRYVSGCQNENTCFYGARRNVLFSVKYRF